MVFLAFRLSYLAIFTGMLRSITPHAPVAQLIAGEVRRGANYTNLRPHGTPDWLLIYTVSGQGKIVAADGRHWLVGPGEAILYEPRAFQDYSTSDMGNWRLRWAHFHPRPHWLPWLRWPPRADGIRAVRLEGTQARRRVVAALAEAVRWRQRQELPGHIDLAANALECALLWMHADQTDGRAWTRTDARVRRALEWLEEEPRRPFSLARLAAHARMSVSRLTHLFKEQVGVSPQRFAERRRLEHACQLLRYTGLSIGEVAVETGYEDAFYFSKRFRRHLGQSPSEFRRLAEG